MWSLLIAVYFIIVTCESKGLKDESDYVLPQFTELDDHEKCLSMKNAFYCVGTFRIVSNGSEKEYFDYIENYSNFSHNYDRTLFRRGYCVSSRCPSHSKTAQGFGKCVQDNQKRLNISLKTLHSCQEKKTAMTTRIDVLDWFYLTILSLILILNIVGTIYGGNSKNFWTSWCVKSNWKELVQPFGNDPDTVTFAPIQGVRVFLMMLVICIHVMVLYGAAFLHDPTMLEQALTTPFMIWAVKAASVVQIFYALSAFLTAHSLLQMSKKQKVNMRILPKQIIKRYFRIAPVHLFIVGFAATLWPHISDGPMWSAKIDTHSAICRERFWSHVFHFNNILIHDREPCLPQTWSLAVDIQFQIISLALTIFMMKYCYAEKIKILSALLIFSLLFNAGPAYINNWKPIIYLMNGKYAPNLGMDLPITRYYYLSTWGSLPSCLMGLLLAHIYYNWRQKGIKLADNKFVNNVCGYAFPLLLLWIVVGQFTRQFESHVILAAYLAAERPVFCALGCIWIFGLIAGVDGPVSRILSWHGWAPLGRLSLSVLMMHWVIIESHLSSQIHPNSLSLFNFLMDFLASWCLSYILAVPLTLLVELPVLNTYKYFLSRNNKINVVTSVETKQMVNGNGKQE